MMRSALTLICALGAAACSPAATCDPQQTAFEAPLLRSKAIGGSVLLTKANDVQLLRVRAALSDLPERWSSSDVGPPGELGLDLNLRYLSEPLGGDGQTEMPRLVVSFDEQAPRDIEPNTSRFPGPGPLSFALRLFDDCEAFAGQCESRLAVRIQRLDGAPFPAISVSWLAKSEARISVCRASSSKAQSTLEVEVEAP